MCKPSNLLLLPPLIAGECVPAKVWDWTERMDLALAPHACNLELLAPLPLAASSTLPELQHCSRLRSLRLQHVHLPALAALAGLTSLLLLDATVFFPDSTPDWLEWAAGLVKLQELRITAAQMRLQPEGGLSSLLPLRRHIQTLRLDDCMVLTDAGAAVMARLCALERLEVTCCRISQAALVSWPGRCHGSHIWRRGCQTVSLVRVLVTVPGH